MDDIFEQMFSTSHWEDGAGVNKATWDALNNMARDSMPTMPLMPLMGGGLDNPGFDRALQEGNERVHSDGLLDNSGGHRAHHDLQSMAVPLWNQPQKAHMPEGPPQLSRGKSDTYLPQGGAIHLDMYVGTRAWNEEQVPLEGHPESMTQPRLPSPQGSGDQQGTSNEDHTGASKKGPLKPRVRARRGQATDPHSIAERNRRERIAERLRALEELVPDSNKTDKASMLDDIICYVKFLQMQVKCLSMCRLGNVGAAVPILADLPTEGAGSFLAAANLAQAHVGLGASQEGMAFSERQVAQLMDEDMSHAMQYLQSKGLCLMPISLATAISSTSVRHEPVPFKEVLKQAMDVKGAVPSKNEGASIVLNNVNAEEKTVDNIIQTTGNTQKDGSCKGIS